jgi:hypothetical protein
MVPGHLVPHNGSSIDWSLRTNSLHGQMVPKNLVPMDKWSSTNLVPLDKWSIEYSVCLGGQAVGIRKYRDRIGWGPFVQGDQILKGPFVHGDRICWGPFVQGDHLSRGTGSPGIKWVRDQMRRSRRYTCLSKLCVGYIFKTNILNIFVIWSRETIVGKVLTQKWLL